LGYHFFEPKHFQEVFPNTSSKTNLPVYRLKGDMREMDIATTETLKEELMSRDPEFRELAREHTRYEQRLSELSALAYPSDEEQLEEVTLKKKKLALKDQMYSIMMQAEKNQSVSH
jgi:uncharacterized protein YdcH (DUF465 family)